MVGSLLVASYGQRGAIINHPHKTYTYMKRKNKAN